MESMDQLPTGENFEQKIAGWLLVGSSAAAVALMSRHPTFDDGPAMLRHMHGSIITVMLIQAVGLLLFVRQRATALSQVGIFIFMLALIGGLTAGTIDGFITPALMESLPRAEHRPLYQMLWEANQATAMAGVLLTSLSYSMWGADLWRHGWRSTAIAAMGAAVVPAAALLGGFVTMDIGGALFCYAVQAAWVAWLGVALLRGRT